MTNKFKNTCIKTGHLSVDEVYIISSLYRQASGYPYGHRVTGIKKEYHEVPKYMATDTQVLGEGYSIVAVDNLDLLMVDSSDLKEITEKDLIDHIKLEIKLNAMAEEMKDWDIDFKESVSGGWRNVSMKRTPPKNHKKQSNAFFPDTLKTFSIEELNGKGGTISVSVDRLNGKGIRVVSFHSDDGNMYVISVDEV